MGLTLAFVEEPNENMENQENSNPELRTMTFPSTEKYVDVCTLDGDSMFATFKTCNNQHPVSVDLMKDVPIRARKWLGLSKPTCLDV